MNAREKDGYKRPRTFRVKVRHYKRKLANGIVDYWDGDVFADGRLLASYGGVTPGLAEQWANQRVATEKARDRGEDMNQWRENH